MRVMVVNQSDQLRQVLQYVLEQGVAVDIVGETNDLQGLDQEVNRLQPDWLFLLQEEAPRLRSVLDHVFQAQPNLQVILLTADGQHVRFQKDWHGHTEIDSWPEYTLSDFIYAMKEVSPSPVAVKSIEDVGTAQPPKFAEGERHN